MKRHTMDVWDKHWTLAQTLTGQRNPASFLREMLDDGLAAYQTAQAAVAVQEPPAVMTERIQKFEEAVGPGEWQRSTPDPGYQHDYWTVVIGQPTQCNGCRGPLRAGETIVAQHYLYASGYRAKHYFGMSCCMKVRER